MKILQQPIAALVVLLLTSCAVDPNKYDINKHGIAAGALEIAKNENLDVYSVNIIIKKKGDLIGEAVNVYLKPGARQTFARILPEGEYVVTNIRIKTAFKYELVEEDPPVTFEVKKNEKTYLDRLVVHLKDKEGLFGNRVLGEEIELSVSKEDQQKLAFLVDEQFAVVKTLDTMSVNNQTFLEQPITLKITRSTEGK